MQKDFSKHWKSSKQPRKQRKYNYNAPLHIKKRLLSTHLSKELIKNYKTRNISVKKGDTVEILRGQFRKIKGKITRVNLKKTRVYVEGAQLSKRDGTKAYYPIHPSNLRIIELDLTDKKRKQKLEKLGKNVSQKAN